MSQQKGATSDDHQFIDSVYQLVSICLRVPSIQTKSGFWTHVSRPVKGSAPAMNEKNLPASALYAAESTRLPTNEITP
jgi:hypothetical protein